MKTKRILMTAVALVAWWQPMLHARQAAQVREGIIPPSPSAFAMANYGHLQPSLYTGTARNRLVR